MTTVLERETVTQQGGDTGNRYCEGCPRCQDSGAIWCNIRHPKFNNLHPVCKRCGHCVLCGKHNDDTSDLEDTPEMGPANIRQVRNMEDNREAAQAFLGKRPTEFKGRQGNLTGFAPLS